MFLVACALSASSSADQPPRHYRGVVLDADTNAPVGDVDVTACRTPFALTYLANDIRVVSTRSRKDGSFDLVVSAASPKPDSILADIRLSAARYAHPRIGQLGFYAGRLDSISEHRKNVVFMKKSYVE